MNRKTALKIVGGILALAAAYEAFLWAPVGYDLIRKGFLSKPAQREYGGTNIANLQALRTALLLYHDSEGQFPKGSGWMDAIEPRLKTYEYGDSALKKLVRPDLLGQKDAYGYAMNDACAGKYKDDIKNPDETPLIFVCGETAKNAHGDPKSLLPNPPMAGGNVGISVSGKILKL